MILGLKGQRSQVQKHIEGDRVVGVSYALYRVPTASVVITNFSQTPITAYVLPLCHHW